MEERSGRSGSGVKGVEKKRPRLSLHNPFTLEMWLDDWKCKKKGRGEGGKKSEMQIDARVYGRVLTL